MACGVLYVLVCLILLNFCVFAYHASTHRFGALLNVIPIAWGHLLLAAGKAIGKEPLSLDDAGLAAIWICVAAMVGALLARRGRLLSADGTIVPGKPSLGEV